jgi:uncharacterized membrane protein
MVVYHGAWFASDAGVVDLPIRTNLGWVAFQKSIASTFFGLVGVSLQLSAPRPPKPVLQRAFFQRLGLILGGAAIVTTTSIVLDPQRTVTFGILHAIATCTVLTLPLLRAPTAVVGPLALVALTAGITVRLPAFDHPALHWTGLSPHVAPTFDHQPLLPWFGVVLLGVVLGRLLPQSPVADWSLQGPLPRFLRLCGRHSLFLYMAHVPVLVGIVALLVWLT